jgi:hypothetical protein
LLEALELKKLIFEVINQGKERKKKTNNNVQSMINAHNRTKIFTIGSLMIGFPSEKK